MQMLEKLWALRKNITTPEIKHLQPTEIDIEDSVSSDMDASYLTPKVSPFLCLSQRRWTNFVYLLMSLQRTSSRRRNIMPMSLFLPLEHLISFPWNNSLSLTRSQCLPRSSKWPTFSSVFLSCVVAITGFSKYVFEALPDKPIPLHDIRHMPPI